MAPHDISRIHGVAALRPAGREANTQPATANPAGRGPAPDRAAVRVELAGNPDLRQIPVDADRVAEIRGALQDGSYPLVPARTADAMIAARMLLVIEA